MSVYQTYLYCQHQCFLILFWVYSTRPDASEINTGIIKDATYIFNKTFGTSNDVYNVKNAFHTICGPFAYISAADGNSNNMKIVWVKCLH